MPYTIEYDYDAQGYITSKGKFEVEQWFIPVLWDEVENNCDEIIYDELDNKPYYIFFIQNNELLKREYIGKDDYVLILYERDDGFVVSGIHTELGYDFFMRGIDEDYE